MPTSSKLRARSSSQSSIKRPKAKVPPSGAEEQLDVGRRERRRRDARTRLLRAALELIADKGVNAVAINEITEAADVGFGSFYTHFESKAAIYDALIQELLGHFGAALDRMGEVLTDPSEKIASSIRYVILRGQKDVLWAKFLVLTGQTEDGITRGLGSYLMRDMGAGLQAKRFRLDDPAIAFVAIASMVMGGLALEVDYHKRGQPMIPGLDSTDGLGERLATVALQLLGLPLKEAHAVARRPLPAVDLPQNPFLPEEGARSKRAS